jgi:hypothetical protein
LQIYSFQYCLCTFLWALLDFCFIITQGCKDAVAYNPQTVLDHHFKRLKYLKKSIHSVYTNFDIWLTDLFAYGINKMSCWTILHEFIRILECQLFHTLQGVNPLLPIWAVGSFQYSLDIIELLRKLGNFR